MDSRLLLDGLVNCR